MRSSCLALATLATLYGLSASAAEKKTSVPIGTPVSNFTLRDYRGQSVSLDEVGKGKVVVLAMLGTECPLCKLYAPRLAELSNKYADKGVAFLGLDANRQDAVTEIAAYARNHGIEFPILKDLNQTVADRLGATRTPEIIVLDQKRAIRYRGRIDDQYGFKSNANYQKSEPDERNLVAALDELLAGKAVSVAETPLAGCLIGRDRKADEASEVTYSKQISRIMNANCVYCHREGQIAPFALTNYDEVAGWADMIDEVVQAQRMPPWHADPKYGHFENDARLSDEDKAAIAKWVAAGAPQGNPKELPEPPKFADGWLIPKPEQVIYMKDQPAKVPATGVVEYQMFVVDPGWKEDKWIKSIECRPGNPSVVHHILLFVLPPDGKLSLGLGNGNDFLGAFAPGLRPDPLPDGMARLVPAGSKLIFQMHYTPNGTAQEDRSYVGVSFADPKTVRKEVRVNSAVNFVFQLPPKAADHAVKARYIFRQDTLLLTMMPHMHLRGKAFRYEATYPDGTREVLLDVPHYDFGWQTSYRFAKPKLMPQGTRMDCVARFDNSEDNPNNPDPSATVTFGDQTFEEMMIGFFEATPVHEDRLDPTAAKAPPSREDEFAVIYAASKGEPDDNVRTGAFMAMADPEIFRQFGFILKTMVPQVDRVCITAVKDGKVVELYGPLMGLGGGHRHGPHSSGDNKDKPSADKAAKAEAPAETGDGEVEKVILRTESMLSQLPAVPVEGEALAEDALAKKPVMHADVAQAKGQIMQTMAKRGAKSSFHVPISLKGMKATVNFWSTDENAFSPEAQAVLTKVARNISAAQMLGVGPKQASVR